jgi:hypothetical protein
MHGFLKKLPSLRRYFSTVNNRMRITNYFRITSFIDLPIHLIDFILKSVRRGGRDVGLTDYRGCRKCV